jgi:hypothetical protein
MKRYTTLTIILLALIGFATNSFARDLAGIEWQEFKDKSEFIFSGCLIKAELLETKTSSVYGDIQYTYKVYKVFKGEMESKEVTFIASSKEDINKTIGRIAIVALRKSGDQWTLSVDQRSCWPHQNKMKDDFGGYPIYEIPTILLYGFPKNLGKEVALKKAYGDDYRTEAIFVYSMFEVDKNLQKYLQ